MKKFKLSGEAIFYAESIDDAFLKLSEHFRNLSEDKDSYLFDVNTNIRIEPILNKLNEKK